MFSPGDIISHAQMSVAEGIHLQRGMNFRVRGDHSVFLMSLRENAPYDDAIEQDGQVLIYEGHDTPRSDEIPVPKSVDQPLCSPTGRPTQNGLFFEAAKAYRSGQCVAEQVRVYEKIRQGIWVYNGLFRLVDAWQERSGSRLVCKYRLEIINDRTDDTLELRHETKLEHNRMIPSWVKREVWKRDKGQCVECGATTNLHFDHIIPYSKGGSSETPDNIQLLCAKHNLQKRDRIE